MSDLLRVVSSTGFGGGFGTAGCFVRGWARGYRGARGRLRRRKTGAMWEAPGKRRALVLRVGGLVGKGWGLQLLESKDPCGWLATGCLFQNGGEAK